MPALRASKDGGPNIPDHVEAKMEALAAARYAVEGQWILTPAPSLHDVIAKIQYCRERWEGFEWPLSWWTSIMTDLGRIAVEAATEGKVQ
ncbi:hypothetical protein CAF53_08805 [Sphingobium sp. LB126]|nr:hypothetical protein CAF53_08805 [Sphingobium sp. LB126]